MFLKNFYNMVSHMTISGNTSTKDYRIVKPCCADVYQSASVSYIWSNYHDLRKITANIINEPTENFQGSGGAYSDSYVKGIVFGTGNTPVTFDDYKLSGEVIVGLTGNASFTETSDENGYELTATYTLNNSNTFDVTIKEVGISFSAYKSSYKYCGCLLERTVLDIPVTIPAGGVGQVIYKLGFRNPTA